MSAHQVVQITAASFVPHQVSVLAQTFVFICFHSIFSTFFFFFTRKCSLTSFKFWMCHNRIYLVWMWTVMLSTAPKTKVHCFLRGVLVVNFRANKLKWYMYLYWSILRQVLSLLVQFPLIKLWSKDMKVKCKLSDDIERESTHQNPRTASLTKEKEKTWRSDRCVWARWRAPQPSSETERTSSYSSSSNV